jgi:sugar lactone lactonase YvrE
MKPKASWVAIAAVFILTGLWPAGVSAQKAEVVATIVNPELKMNGVAWDGRSVWVTTYQSSPLEWRIARLDENGAILSSFPIPVKSLDDIHNFGMSNIASDGQTIWANHWNEGIVFNFAKDGALLKQFKVASVNQLIPVGIVFDGEYLYVLHWSDKNLYQLDREGNELGKMSLRKLAPPPDMGLAWDGTYFWVGSKGANRITRVTPQGEAKGFIKGPKAGGGIRDLAWDGEHLLVVYSQDSTIYKLKITE